MFDPEKERINYSSILRPPAGFELDLAVATTYSLDLPTLISALIPLALGALGVKDIDCVVSGTGKIDDEYAHITIIYFEENADANDSWEKVQEYADKNKDDDAKDSEWVCKKSGKMIYFGTKNAVAAAK